MQTGKAARLKILWYVCGFEAHPNYQFGPVGKLAKPLVLGTSDMFVSSKLTGTTNLNLWASRPVEESVASNAM